MMSFTYTFSQQIKQRLEEIEKLQREILLVQLSPRDELRLRFEGLVTQMYWSLLLTNEEITKASIAKLLSQPRIYTHAKTRGLKLTDSEKEIIGYKKALDYIHYFWINENRAVTSQTVLILHALLSSGNLSSSERDLKQVLGFTQSQVEHPVLQAAFIQMQLIDSRLFSDGNGRLGRLLARLFLYRGGFYLRGLLSLEEYWRRDLKALQFVSQEVERTKDLTLWLEYFTQGVLTQMEKTLHELQKPKLTMTARPLFYRLNERQRFILGSLDNPDVSITNKTVQRLFGISFMTSARDLAKLTALGHIVPHGKGRGVYYTRG